MTLPAQGWTRESELAFLERLRPAYEQQGYKFVVQPEHELMPSFLGGFRPDAIAEKSNEKIIIEVKPRESSRPDPTIADIRRRISEHPGWRLDVVYVDESRSGSVEIAPVSIELIQKQIDEVRQLQQTGHQRAAFILAWALLEAAFNRLHGATTNRAQSPGQVVQSLAMDGHIDKQEERRLRELVDLRNRIVHGDLRANASTQDVQEIISSIGKTLSNEASSSMT